MNKLFKIMLLFLLIITIAEQDYAQKTIIKKISGFMINEIGAIFDNKDGKVICEMALPSSEKNKDDQNMDIKKNDIILYVNGIKIKNVEDLKKNYENIKIGDEVKLGIKREGDTFISSFKKGDPKDFPQTHKVTIGNPGDEKSETIKKAKIKDGKIIIGGKTLDIDSLKNSGENKIIIKKSK